MTFFSLLNIDFGCPPTQVEWHATFTLTMKRKNLSALLVKQILIGSTMMLNLKILLLFLQMKQKIKFTIITVANQKITYIFKMAYSYIFTHSLTFKPQAPVPEE